MNTVKIKCAECEGKNREMKIVQFQGSPDLVGQVLNIKIIKGLDWVLKGQI